MYFNEKSIDDEIEKNVEKYKLANLNKLTNNQEVSEQIRIANNNSISKNLFINIRLNVLLNKINKIEHNDTLRTIVTFYYFREIIKNNNIMYEEIKSIYAKYDVDFDLLVDTFIEIYDIVCKKCVLYN